MTPDQPAAPAVWIDGHPQLEAIAAAVWEACGRSDSGACVEDDPRNIAVAALAAVLPATVPAAPELTADEARDLADDLGRELYRAQDALAFVEECCVIADREQRPVTTADVREWLKGARCGRQLLADAADRAALRDRIADGQGEPAELRDLPREVRHLVHTVDQMRSDWAEASPGGPERQRMWAKVHAACEAVWNRPLSVLPAPVDRTAMLREAADAIDQHEWDQGCDGVGCCADTPGKAADLLRRMADEAQPEPEAHLAERLARVREWVTSDIVDARSGFGSGYREAQRDIRDLLDGRPPTDEAHKERKAQTRIETEATDALARVRAIAERAASNVQRPAARLARRILAELPGQNACPPRCPCHPDRPGAGAAPQPKDTDHG